MRSRNFRTHVGAMKAFQQMGWLCRRPQVPLAQGDILQRELPEYSYFQRMNHPAPWWNPSPTAPVAEQFENFLDDLATHSREMVQLLQRLLKLTPLDRKSTRLNSS